MESVGRQPFFLSFKREREKKNVQVSHHQAHIMFINVYMHLQTCISAYLCVQFSVCKHNIMCVFATFYTFSFFYHFFPQLQTESLGSGGFELGLVGEPETFFFWPDWKQTTFLPKLI